jgi:pimeloyl-ACP methyl ester carboxylesterase
MENLRKYGEQPFNIVLVHGGPGGAGEIAPVARVLSKDFGILEPLQTKNSIDGQIKELRETLQANANFPVKLVGWSWGAWLSYLFSVNYPKLVNKLILVDSGPFEEKYVSGIRRIRLSRLSEVERSELQNLENALKSTDTQNKDILFEKIGNLFKNTDAYNPDDSRHEPMTISADIYEGVWPVAAKLRQSGELLKMGEKIQCPVIAIHGDHDPHPANGVREPLSRVIKDFQFILLKNCGHKPWIEKEAKADFYEVLRKELDG